MLLGIETSSLVSSVAVADKGRLLGELTVQAGLTHSEQLVPHLDILLKTAGVNKADIEGIVVTIGPGSFTGLRIGLSTAKAMAYAWQKPLIGVKTTEALAYNAVGDSRLLAVWLDAQKNNVYEALYRFDGDTLEVLQNPTVKNCEEALHALGKREEEVLFMGEAALLYREQIEQSPYSFTIAKNTMIIPRAGSLLLAAEPYWERGEVSDAMNVVPYYIRRSEAEVLWEKKQEALYGGKTGSSK